MFAEIQAAKIQWVVIAPRAGILNVIAHIENLQGIQNELTGIKGYKVV